MRVENCSRSLLASARREAAGFGADKSQLVRPPSAFWCALTVLAALQTFQIHCWAPAAAALDLARSMVRSRAILVDPTLATLSWAWAILEGRAADLGRDLVILDLVVLGLVVLALVVLGRALVVLGLQEQAGRAGVQFHLPSHLQWAVGSGVEHQLLDLYVQRRARHLVV